MEVVATTGATRRAKLQANRHQQTRTQLSSGRMQSSNSLKAPKGKLNFNLKRKHN